MGLDMYAYSVEKPQDQPLPKVMSKSERVQSGFELERFHYWSNHPNLHGFMESIYRDQYRGSETFNCVAVLLTEAQLDVLETAIKTNELPETQVRLSSPSKNIREVVEHDLEFIAKARKEIEAGRSVYYESWW